MKSFLRVVLMAVLILNAGSVFADDQIWLGSSTDNHWDVGSNWESESVPGSDDDVFVHYGDDVNGYWVNLWYIDAVSNSLSVGGSMTVSQTGGTHAIGNDLNLGMFNFGCGSYVLNDGDMSVSSINIGAGDVGGCFEQNGGVVEVASLLNIDSGLEESCYFLSAGELNVVGGSSIGKFAVGSFDQTDGLHSTNSLILGENEGSIGEYYLSAEHGDSSLIVVSDEILGNFGRGALSQSSGESGVSHHSVGGSLILGNSSASGVPDYSQNIGIYDMLGGTLEVGENLTVGREGVGFFNQYGGVVNVANDLRLGDVNNGVGFYTLEDGYLSAGAEYLGSGLGGFFEQIGGTHEVAQGLVLGLAANSLSVYTLDGESSLRAGHEIVSSAAVGGIYNDTYEYGARFVHIGGENLIVVDNASYDDAEGIWKVTDSAASGLIIADLAGSTGRYELAGGSLISEKAVFVDEVGVPVLDDLGDPLYDGGCEIVGNAGTGYFYHENGSNTAAFDVNLGQLQGSYGKYELFGSLDESVLMVGRNLNVGLDGEGVFEQSGGSVFVQESIVLGGNGAYGMGEYSLSDGAVNAVNLYVGGDGKGVFTQDGGEVTVGSELKVNGSYGVNDQWYDSAVDSAYILNSGTLNKMEYEVKIGTWNEGYFFQNGGDFVMNGAMYLGDHAGGYGVYTMTDGNLMAGSEGAGFVLGEWGGTGKFLQTGGSVTFDSVTLGRQSAGNGLYYMNTGSVMDPVLNTGTTEVGLRGTGLFDQRAGLHEVSGDLIVGGFAGSSGTYYLRDGALSVGNSILVQRDAGSSGVFEMTGGALNANNVVNNGVFSVSNASPLFTGTFINNGVLQSDPSELTFGNLEVSATGYIVASAGDSYVIVGDFYNSSTAGNLWNTSGAALTFAALGSASTSVHNFSLAGADKGIDGYTDNFAWQSLNLGENDELSFSDGNPLTDGGAFYVREITGLDIDMGALAVSNVYGSDGFVIYYDPLWEANSYLNGQTFTLANGGRLAPNVVPEPASMLLFALGGGAFAMFRKRKV